MKMSEYIKKCGFVSVKQVVDTSGVSRETLGNWYNNKRKLFDIVLLGCRVVVSDSGELL